MSVVLSHQFMALCFNSPKKLIQAIHNPVKDLSDPSKDPVFNFAVIVKVLKISKVM